MISFYWWQLYNQIVMGRDIKRYWSSAMSTSVIFHHKYKLFKKMKRKKETKCFFCFIHLCHISPYTTVIEKQIVFESHDGVSLFLSALGLVHLSHAVKIGPFPIYQWSVPNQCWLLSMIKKKIHSLSPPQRVCCVCVNKFTFCVNQNAFRAKCMKRLCMWIKFMPATFAAMFLSPGFQAGGKFWKIKIQK